MPKRSSDQNQLHPTLRRRSPRFIHHAELERVEDPNPCKLKQRTCQVRRSPYAVLALAASRVQNPLFPKTLNSNTDRVSKKVLKLRQDLSERFDEVSALRRSPRLNSGVDGCTWHEQPSVFSSDRVLEKAVPAKEKNFTHKGFSSSPTIPTTPRPDPDKIFKKCSKFGSDLVKPAVGVRRSPRLSNVVVDSPMHKQSLRAYTDGIVVKLKKKKKNKSVEKTAGSSREKIALDLEKENVKVVLVDKVKSKNKRKREDKTGCLDREKGAVGVENNKEKVKKESKREDKTASLNREEGALEVNKEKGSVVDKVKNTNKSKHEDKFVISNRKKGAVAVEEEKEKISSAVHKLKNKKSKRGDKIHGSVRERGADTVEQKKEQVLEKVRKSKRSCSGSLHGHYNENLVSDKIPFGLVRTEKGCIVTEVNGEIGEISEISSEDEIRVKMKRKPGMDSNGVVQGWTKEQEVALQTAYYASKPTPHFWKNVSKLVPGKSAQECFDKINSDHVTPPQAPAQSRAKKISSVSIEQFPVSASKLLEPSEVKSKRSKRRDNGGWKSIRNLLQKNCLVNEENGADLFSILEPDVDVSVNLLPDDSPMISTPVHKIAVDGLLMNCQEGCSDQKGHRSKFSSSSVIPIVSPPVLKPVKNRVLHEKYIDKLHSRDAKRKAESRRGKHYSGKENRETLSTENVDGVKVAKSYLCSRAMDAIYELKHLHEDSVVSSDLEDGGIEVGDGDGDLEL